MLLNHTPIRFTRGVSLICTSGLCRVGGCTARVTAQRAGFSGTVPPAVRHYLNYYEFPDTKPKTWIAVSTFDFDHVSNRKVKKYRLAHQAALFPALFLRLSSLTIRCDSTRARRRFRGTPFTSAATFSRARPTLCATTTATTMGNSRNSNSTEAEDHKNTQPPPCHPRRPHRPPPPLGGGRPRRPVSPPSRRSAGMRPSPRSPPRPQWPLRPNSSQSAIQVALAMTTTTMVVVVLASPSRRQWQCNRAQTRMRRGHIISISIAISSSISISSNPINTTRNRTNLIVHC